MHRPKVSSSWQNRDHMSAVTCWGRGGCSQRESCGSGAGWGQQMWFQSGLRWGVQAVWSDLLRINNLAAAAFLLHFANFAAPSAALVRNPASELLFFLCRMGIRGFCSSLAFSGLRRCGLFAAGTAGYFRHMQHQWRPSFSSVSPPLLIDSRASASSSGCGLSIFCCETSWCSLCG